ncbi:lysosomal acid phosphatase-like [Sitophilus oryzae]|uniref:acid phosphatase n=1 Tax=Sitophilus oryzae TaxID=7048 RepID=A0A6J2X8W3_SITOR|nr:lysosomal acid phosphatase-like [Sitophilus oryzae]
MFGTKILLVFLFLKFNSSLGDENDQLKAVVVVFRHGDRSPLSSWPNDVYYNDTSLWPDGYGQLNNLGKQHHYELGQWFRERYDNFLPARYNRKDIYVRSTDVDRTLMSAESNLAGLYPITEDTIWNDNILWQVIPVHTVPESQDPILASEIPCAKHARLEKELYQTEEFQELNRQYAELYKNISEVTGFFVDEVDIGTMSGLFSAITIYRGQNLSLPSWTDYYWEDIKTLAAKKFQVPTYTTDLARLRTGPFYNYFSKFLNATRDQTPFTTQGLSYTPKFLMLSAHDTTLGDFTNSMGVYPDAVPEFTSTLIWEIRSRNQDETDLYLNVYYKNSTDFSPLTVKECAFDCGLDDFTAIMSPVAVTVDEWEAECKDTN